MTESSTPPRTIVLIHGLWMTPRSWEHWKTRYEAAGHTVLAPAWPGMEGEVEALNRDSSPIARLEFDPILEHYERLIRRIDPPPIIMGHSTGGTILQIMLDRGLGAAEVGIASAAGTTRKTGTPPGTFMRPATRSCGRSSEERTGSGATRMRSTCCPPPEIRRGRGVSARDPVHAR